MIYKEIQKMYLLLSSCIYPCSSTVNKRNRKRDINALYLEESCQCFTLCHLLNKYRIVNIVPERMID